MWVGVGIDEPRAWSGMSRTLPFKRNTSIRLRTYNNGNSDRNMCTSTVILKRQPVINRQ